MGMNNRTLRIALLLIPIVLICFLAFFIISKSKYNFSIIYEPDMDFYDNPLIGYAPMANEEEYCKDTRFVYLKVTWAEWEPEEGFFDIDGLEKKYNVKKWKSENKHAVLRLMCDIPRHESHMDIPEWLLEKTDTGVFYDTEMGKGYSPDYSDPVFMEYHRKALEALADYCNKDHFVSFVQLGSLGHWGEWHVRGTDDANLMPDKDICMEYADLYSKLFTNALCMTRRNYEFAINRGMGVYNDMVGHDEDTGEWLDWLRNGGSQSTSGERLEYKPFNDIWLSRPVGGELTSSIPMDELLGGSFNDTLRHISSSGMIFLGPKIPDFTEEYESRCEEILKQMGYRIYLSKLESHYDYFARVLDLSLSFRNAGNAGFYFDWPVCMVVLDKDKNEVFSQKLDIDLRTLSKDADTTAAVTVPLSEKLKDEFYIGIRIRDLDDKENLTLAQSPAGNIEYIDDIQIIHHFQKDNKSK